MSRLAALLVVVALVPLVAVAAGGRSYRNDVVKVRAFEPPAGWTMLPLPPGSAGRLLAMYEDHDGARLTLAAQKTAPGTTARALADESRPVLERHGLRGVTITVERPPGEEQERARLEAT